MVDIFQKQYNHGFQQIQTQTILKNNLEPEL